MLHGRACVHIVRALEMFDAIKHWQVLLLMLDIAMLVSISQLLRLIGILGRGFPVELLL